MRPSNPYIAGNPVRGQEKFIGRADVLRDVERTLRHPDENAIVLFGQRRIGKTSVLLNIERDLAAKQEYTPIYFDLQDKAALPLAALLYQMAQKIAFITKTPLPERKQFDAMGTFFRETFIPAAVQTCQNQGLVLLLDEFDVLDMPKQEQAVATFFPYLRDWMSTAKGIQFVFVLGRRPEELSTDTLSAFKAIRSCRVSLMTREDTDTIIHQSEQNESLTWSNEAVERIWYWTQGHPYFTQLLCSEIWETLVTLSEAKGHESPFDSAQGDAGHGERSRTMTVNPENVDAAIDRTLEQGAHAFQWIWNGLPPAERIVMAAMAEAKTEQITPEELAEILNQSKVRLILRDLELAPETLVQWDLLRPVDNGFRFAIPLLRRWVNAEKPLRRVKADLDSVEPLAENLYRSGEGFSKIGNLTEAEQHLRYALNINPNHFKARLLLGQVLIAQGNPAKAVAELEPAYQFDPRSAQADYIRALLALAETPNEDEQLEIYNRILAIAPTQIIALEKKRTILSSRAETALRKADFETALKIYAELGDLERKRTILSDWAETALRKTDFETALKIYTELDDYDKIHDVQTKKLHVDQQLAAVRKYEETGNWSDIYSIYEELLAEFPDQETWRIQLKTSSREFEFDVITVNASGEEIKRDHKKAYQQAEDLGGGVTLEMVYIPGGVFLMGSPETEEGRNSHEGPQHQVTIAPFYMGKYPVTQEQWEAVMEDNSSELKGAKRPVESISWDAAVKFCKRLSEGTGKTYRLPSETEWEYACRAGTITPFYFGETITPELANYDNKYNGTTEVGKFPPNAFGLYDMHGNVWEWCADPWHDNYEGAPSDGLVWEGDSWYRVRRGGSWDFPAWSMRCAYRGYYWPHYRLTNLGFRLARTI